MVSIMKISIFIMRWCSLKYFFPVMIDRRTAEDLFAAEIIDAAPKLYAKLSKTPPIPIDKDWVRNMGFLRNLNTFSLRCTRASIAKVIKRIVLMIPCSAATELKCVISYLNNDMVIAALIAENNTNRIPFLLKSFLTKTRIKLSTVIPIPIKGRMPRWYHKTISIIRSNGIVNILIKLKVLLSACAIANTER